jgi:hypothetical protein
MLRLEARSRRAITRKTLSAKCGVWLTRNRNCFSPTGTSFFEHAIAEPDLDPALLNDEQLLGIVALMEDDIACLEFARWRACASQYSKIDRRVGPSETLGQVGYRRSVTARYKSREEPCAPSATSLLGAQP